MRMLFVQFSVVHYIPKIKEYTSLPHKSSDKIIVKSVLWKVNVTATVYKTSEVNLLPYQFQHEPG
jgi:hypothetical protein